MSHILVVTGSVRPNSVNQKVVPVVVSVIEEKGARVIVADLGALNLPFFDSPTLPSSPDFVVANDNVKRWTGLVREADGVVLVTPEYNHTLSPVQLNAIDWISKEWLGKPVALVGYGMRSGATQAHSTAREALASVLGAHVANNQTNLYIWRDLELDGSAIDLASVKNKISTTIDELIDLVGRWPRA